MRIITKTNLGTSFKSGAWQPGQKPMVVVNSSLNIRDFMEGIAGMGPFLEVVADPAELLMLVSAETLEFFKDILPS